MNVIEELEKQEIRKLSVTCNIPVFAPGDTVRVNVKVVEGSRERVQAFEGVCIGRKNSGINSAFTVRKLSYGEGVERVFPLYSPTIDSIQVIRRGDVRRAKLYYLRGRAGKSARIAEQTDGYKAKLSIEDRRVSEEQKREGKKATKTQSEKISDVTAEEIESPPTGKA